MNSLNMRREQLLSIGLIVYSAVIYRNVPSVISEILQTLYGQILVGILFFMILISCSITTTILALIAIWLSYPQKEHLATSEKPPVELQAATSELKLKDLKAKVIDTESALLHPIIDIPYSEMPPIVKSQNTAKPVYENKNYASFKSVSGFT